MRSSCGLSSVFTGVGSPCVSFFFQRLDKLHSWAEVWKEFSVTEIGRLRAIFETHPRASLDLTEVRTGMIIHTREIESWKLIRRTWGCACTHILLWVSLSSLCLRRNTVWSS